MVRIICSFTHHPSLHVLLKPKSDHPLTPMVRIHRRFYHHRLHPSHHSSPIQHANQHHQVQPLPPLMSSPPHYSRKPYKREGDSGVACIDSLAPSNGMHSHFSVIVDGES
ncbi:hypothetical protein RIF29_13749 [Crotalaria pallida]|uniref:Uncharacterized protein n=1 Tax=Crotalaria pallida TaxID=3830 RepID=A0AAN9P2D9_CROPI